MWFLSLCFCVSPCWIFGCTFLAANFKIYSRGHKLEYFDPKAHLVSDNVRVTDYAGCLLKERVWPRISGHLCWAIILSRWTSAKRLATLNWWWWCTFDLSGHVKQRELSTAKRPQFIRCWKWPYTNIILEMAYPCTCVNLSQSCKNILMNQMTSACALKSKNWGRLRKLIIFSQLN